LSGGVSLALGRVDLASPSVLFDGARGTRIKLGRITFSNSNSANIVTLDDSRKVVVPKIYNNQTLRNVLRKKTIPPSPLPSGVTARATLGTRKLEYIQILQERLGDKANAREIQAALQRATKLAEKLQFNDKMINDLQAGRIKSLEAFNRMEQWARAERKQFALDLFDMLSGGFSAYLGELEMLKFKTNMAELLYAKHRSPRHWLLLSTKYGPKVKTLLGDINTAKKSIESGDNSERNMAILTRSVDLMEEINKEIKLIPESKITKRIPGYASLAVDTVKASYKLLEVHYNIKDIEVLSEQVGKEEGGMVFFRSTFLSV